MLTQIQNNIARWQHKRLPEFRFGYAEVTSKDCLSCHERSDDRHPTYRFRESRFAEARATIAPHHCMSCHQEHLGVRVSTPPSFCVHCHDDLSMTEDPLDVSHEKLVQTQNWESCLGCHDFHGNHVMDSATRLEEALAIQRIQTYFEGGQDPYSEIKHVKAKGNNNEN